MEPIVDLLYRIGEALIVMLLLGFIVERLVLHISTPFRRKFAWLDQNDWLIGLVALFGGLPLGLLLTFDPFNGLFIYPEVGKVLAGLLIGAGSNVIHDVYKKLLELISTLVELISSKRRDAGQ